MKLLVISHNTPFPPNKGEKMRSFHLIKELSKDYEIVLCSLCRDPEDIKYQRDLEQYCSEVSLFPLNPWRSKLGALSCLLFGRPMTLGYFGCSELKRSLEQRVQAGDLSIGIAFCSSAAQYLLPLKLERKILDYVDIDSEKWAQYSRVGGVIKKIIYAIEAKRLARWEVQLYQQMDLLFVTTDREKYRLGLVLNRYARSSIPHQPKKCAVITQGVDLKYSSPPSARAASGELTVGFSGQMDYLPNIDAVIYFYLRIWPIILRSFPAAKFLIIGRNPSAKLYEICRHAKITGDVEDVKIHLAQCAVIVAPIRLSFGCQNKILEAMAAGIPVVSTSAAAAGISAVSGRDLLVADSPESFARCVSLLLSDARLSAELSENGRSYVLAHHAWDTIGAEARIQISRLYGEELLQRSQVRDLKSEI